MNRQQRRSKDKQDKNIATKKAIEALQRAVFLHQNGKLAEATEIYDQVLRILPNQPDALHLRGVIALQNGAPELAANLMRSALKSAPNNVDIYSNLGAALHALKDFYGEFLAYEKAYKLAPNDYKILNELVKSQRLIANWDDLENRIGILRIATENALAENKPSPISPYHALTLPISPILKKNIARQYAKNISKSISPFPPRVVQKNERIKIGYVSADFRDHPTGHLLGNFFEYHNRNKFEVFAYMTGFCDGSYWQNKIQNNVEHWVEFDPQSTASKIAEKIYNDGIDILFDVMGYIQNSKPQIFAHRPAPIQINFLAYPGTMGADYIQYVIADDLSAPPSADDEFSEKILRMPNSYFVMDAKYDLPESIARAELGFKDDDFIFCAFNKTDKIEEKIFALWMKILHTVPHGILWLYADSDIAIKNLTSHAAKYNILESRLRFARRSSKNEHLARLQVADLFLDCALVSAHTTAIDSIFAGVPVLALKGNSFITRATESILHAAKMPEWVVKDFEAYFDMAVKYAGDIDLQKNTKAKMRSLRNESKLFDSKSYVKNLEGLIENIV